ncbi:carboxymuconolactone decarboxylase family protein [Hymenobacter lucidus]|uniref:Carboxymuconolactone decarboxylase family protein n=1 Tax=Hymenobacter lucidus TaxID=2880930 RepID=A0ABS8AZ54_9BACT|nr:carboxymuconolactone decarboxylase family protein [Hymenobacter lucidus]MCB2411091.1 carboxymuconolactone decarboxylase family protein [Hymenobacter lucidus]
MKRTLHLAAAFALLLLSIMNTTAQPTAMLARQQALVTIAAYTATGNQARLHEALTQGLKAGMTVNEEKEVLVHLYAYCGFPRSLSGINTLMQLLEERKAQGIEDVMGKAASPITSTAPKYERGKQNLEKLTGKPEIGPKTGANAFSPESDVFLKEHLFADLFERDVLTFQERELATIAALVSLGSVEPMLQFHLGAGLHVGLTEAQLRQLIGLCEAAVSKQQVEAAHAVLTRVVAASAK